jgi:hypothetical protein
MKGLVEVGNTAALAYNTGQKKFQISVASVAVNYCFFFFFYLGNTRMINKTIFFSESFSGDLMLYVAIKFNLKSSLMLT